MPWKTFYTRVAASLGAPVMTQLSAEVAARLKAASVEASFGSDTDAIEVLLHLALDDNESNEVDTGRRE